MAVTALRLPDDVNSDGVLMTTFYAPREEFPFEMTDNPHASLSSGQLAYSYHVTTDYLPGFNFVISSSSALPLRVARPKSVDTPDSLRLAETSETT